MADPVWKVGYCEYDVLEGGNGQVKVTTLHYNVTLTEEPYTANSIGTTPDDGNRVYTLAALEAVPEQVMVGWVHQALGQEEIDRIEDQLAANIAEQKTPTSGGFVPEEDTT